MPPVSGLRGRLPGRSGVLAWLAAVLTGTFLVGASAVPTHADTASGSRTSPTPMPSPSAAPAPPARRALPDNQSQLYVLDGWGGVHSVNGSPALATSAYWQGWDIARGLAMLPTGTGGLVLDGWGGLHAVGSGVSQPAPSGYWTNWDIARSIALAPWATASAPAGWTLDGWGGIHPFGGAPAIALPTYWRGWDIARQIVVSPDSTTSAVSGYVLDGWGGLHAFGGAAAIPAPAYWPNWDIARGVSLLPTSTAAAPAGYVVDGWGGLHAFGSSTPAPTGYTYWPGWDIARGVVSWTQGAGGWVLDGWGGVHSFSGAPAATGAAYWRGWDIARGMAGPGSAGDARTPPPPPPVKRKIVVSLSLQHLWAWEGDRLFLETDVTTGRPELPTPVGDFHIFYRASPYQMISPWPPGSPYYYPPTWIAYAMEFIDGGYFLHDAPWRTWFGPGSEYYGDGTHGCVNVPGGQGWGPVAALWNWAQIGDEVVVQN